MIEIFNEYEQYILLQGEYQITFSKDKITFEYLKTTEKTNSSNSIYSQVKEFLSKMIYGNKIDNNFTLTFKDDISNLKLLVDKELNKIQYVDEKECIILEMQFKENVMDVYVNVYDNWVSKQLKFDLLGSFSPLVDGLGNFKIIKDGITIIFNKPNIEDYSVDFMFKDLTLDVFINRDSINLKTGQDVENMSISNYENLQQELNNQMQVMAVKDDEQEFFIGTRTLYASIDKIKFNSPLTISKQLKSLVCVPIIEDLYSDYKIEEASQEIQNDMLCPNKAITVYFDMKKTNFTPYVSYAIALKSNKYESVNDYNGIFEYVKDEFLGEPFSFCALSNSDVEYNYKKVDFKIKADVVETTLVTPETSLDCEMYKIVLDLYVVKLNDLELDEETTKALNKSLGRDENSTEPITRGELENITEFTLIGNHQFDASILRYMINLEKLTLNDDNLTNDGLSNVSNLNKLSYVNLAQNSTLTSGDALSLLTNIESLNINYTSISNLAFTENLTKIKELNGDTTQDLSSLSISTFATKSNKIVNISILSNLINLEKLSLSGHEIKDISVLEKLVKLTDVNLSSNKIDDISVVENLNNLVNIDFTDQTIEGKKAKQFDTDTFRLDLDTINYKDGCDFSVFDISDGGRCESPDSSLCESIIWEIVITENKEVSFKFESCENEKVLFSGKVLATLIP